MNSIKRVLPSAANRIKIYLNHRGEPLYRRWYYQQSKRLRKFKDIHAGESCFIIGNGPSLRQMDLSLLKDHCTFGLNKIYLLFDKVDINLSYHVAVNRLVIEQSIKQFETIKCPSFLSYTTAYDLVDKNDHTFFIYTGGPYTFQKDITSKICEGHTVTYVAMQIAYFMGFSRVFLIGVDHNFITQGKANQYQFMEGNDPNHFDSRYFKNNHWQLPNIEASELSYQLARYFFNKDKRYIYDATIEGKLNIFPKVSFEEALEQAKNHEAK